MKKNALSVFTALFAALFLFNSCSNFLNGSDLKNQLGKIIEYKNTTPCKVTISSEYGKITNSGTYSLKSTDKMTIEYSENNSHYQFITWSCKPENSVTFSSKDTANVTFTVNDSSADILVFPVIYKRLQVTEFFPDSKQSEYTKDTSIIIKFSEIPAAENDFSSIRILSDTEDFTSYFNAPELKENELIFTVNKNKDLPIEKGTKKSIKVEIPASLYYEVSDNKIFLSNEYAFSYMINSKTDETVPDIKLLKVSRTNGKNPKEFTQGNFEQTLKSVGKELFFTIENCVNKLNVEFNVTDSDSGIASIKFIERLLYGIDLSSNTKEKIVSLDEYLLDKYNATGNYTYNFSTLGQDGIFELDISFIDNNGNESNSFTYSFLKKQNIYDDGIYISPGSDSLQNTNIDFNPSTMKEKIEADKYVVIYNLTDEKIATYDGETYTSSYSNLNLKLELLNENNKVVETQTVSVNDVEKNSDYYVYKFQNVLNKEPFTYRLTIKDFLGNEKTIDYYITPAPKLANVTYYSKTPEENYYKLDFTSTADHNINSKVFTQIWWSKDLDSVFNHYCNSSDYDFEDYDGYIIPVNSPDETVYMYINYGDGEFCNFSDLYTITPSMVNIPDNDESMKPVFEYEYSSTGVINSQYNILKISFTEADFNKYDFITVNFYNDSGNELYSEIIDSPVSCIKIEAVKMINYKFNVTGIKNSKSYSSSQKVINNLPDKYDCFAPSIKKIDMDNFNSALKIQIIDYPSGNIENLTDSNGFVKIKIADMGYDYSTELFWALTDSQKRALPYTEYNLMPEYENGNYYLYFPLSKYHLTYDEYRSQNDKRKNFCLYLEDKNGNYTYSLAAPEIYWKKTNHYVYYDTNNKIQKFIRDGGEKYFSFMISDNWSSTISVDNDFNFNNYLNTYTPKVDFCFFRFISGYSEKTYDRPLYCASEKRNCQIKDFEITKYQKDDNIVLYHDQPVFFQRLVCSENFEDDIDSWERWTTQLNKQHEKVYNPDGTFISNFSLETNDIPEGMYYCYVVYFSDNSYKMSNVFYKDN